MKKFLTSMLVLGITAITPALAFSDVSEDFWAYEKIQEMYRSGVISGFEDGTFKPQNMITREQAAAIMTNFFELSQKDDIKKYEDVPNGHWSSVYDELLGQYMPVDEVEGKYYFRPADAATRIEIAETIVKIIGYDDEQINDDIINNFSDNADFSEKDKKYISAVANNGIMVGDDQQRFRPNDTITRAEFCALIYNIYLMRDDLKAQNTEKVVATVNGEEVKYADFNLYFNLQKKIYESMFGTAEIWSEEIEGVTLHEIVKESTKNGIVSDRIKLQKAKEMGIELSEDIKMEISNYVNSSQGIEICEFYGISKEDFEKINIEKFLISDLVEKIYGTLDHSQHTHADINGQVDTVTYDARHILLSTEGLTEEEKEKVRVASETLLEKVKNGEDFATLAAEYSVDAGSNQNGGLYEDISLGEFVSEFETAALSLSDGMIYPELVESPYGYHIIKLEAKKQAKRDLTDEEKQEIISADLDPIVSEWIENSVITVNEEVYKSL